MAKDNLVKLVLGTALSIGTAATLSAGEAKCGAKVFNCKHEIKVAKCGAKTSNSKHEAKVAKCGAKKETKAAKCGGKK